MNFSRHSNLLRCTCIYTRQQNIRIFFKCKRGKWLKFYFCLLHTEVNLDKYYWGSWWNDQLWELWFFMASLKQDYLHRQHLLRWVFTRCNVSVVARFHRAVRVSTVRYGTVRARTPWSSMHFHRQQYPLLDRRGLCRKLAIDNKARQ